MSWLYSQALVEEYLGDISLDGEQFAPSSGNPTQQAYLSLDKMKVFSRLSRFGMMYKPLTESRGEELLTLYLAGFHAKTSQPQGGGQELTENDQECGQKWHASFTKYSPVTHSWKTHQCSLLGDLDEFSETWPQWGLMRDGECWEQKTLEQTIRGTEFGSKQQMFPTPVKSEGHGSMAFKLTDAVQASMGKDMPKMQKNPQMWEKFKNWPTPTAHMAKETSAPSEHKRNTPTLTAQANWSTPTASDTCARKTKYAQGGTPLSMQAGGSLNPTWVEWLMGWPLGWTDLKPLEMDKSHSVLQQHGES